MSYRKRSRLFEELILKSWWAILFFLLCFFLYDQAVKRRSGEEDSLRNKLALIDAEQVEAEQVHDELQRQIAGQNDDYWIELILMQKLGLVPEGQIKVHFNHKNAP